MISAKLFEHCCFCAGLFRNLSEQIFLQGVTFMKAYNFFVCGMIAAVIAEIPISAQNNSTGRWFARRPLPTPRQEMPLTLYDGRIFVTGGFNSNGVGTSFVEVFTPLVNTWTEFFDVPVALHHLGLVTLNSRLYVVGGYHESGFISQGRLFEYDFRRGNWEAKRTMLTPRGAHVAVVFGGKIYAIGGANGGSGVATNEVYDPATNQWTQLAPMPTAREHLAAAVIDSLIYVVGGRVSSFIGNLVNLPALEAYSPATNTWRTLPDMPTPRGGLAAAAMNGKLYVFGGEYFTSSGSGVFASNEEYDPTTRTWRTMRPLPTPRHGMSAVTIGDTIFVIGGGPIAGYSVTAVNEGFTLSPEPTHVEQRHEPARAFALRQNCPNPFNAATKISFTLPRAEIVTLQIYDVTGKAVAELARREMSAGGHNIIFEDESLPSGIYYYTLRAGAEVQTRKMLLMR